MTSSLKVLAIALIATAAAATPVSALQAGAVRGVAREAVEERAEQPEFVAGQICWAFYEPHLAWYAAHVVGVEADSLRVRHFDGFEEWVAPHYVTQDDLAAGDSLSAWFRADAEWYSVEIVERRGLEVVVRYSDGVEETTWMRWLRMLTGEAPTG